MVMIARILAVSLLSAGAAALIGFVCFTRPDGSGLALVLGVVAAIVGAVAGAAREVATAVRSRDITDQ